MTRRGRAISLWGGAVAATWGLLYRLGRTWGSTRAERGRYLPGDELVDAPRLTSDHAVTIEASASSVWPWLVQMGWGRGGYYTYRWVDRLLFPNNPPSSDVILAEYQDLSIGDHVPDGAPETGCFYVVELLEPGKYLVLRSTTHLPPQLRDKPGVHMEWTWGFYVDEHEDGCTRLLFRVRGTLRPWWLLALYRLFIVPADLVMSRSFCRGIKVRAESSYPKKG